MSFVSPGSIVTSSGQNKSMAASPSFAYLGILAFSLQISIGILIVRLGRSLILSSTSHISFMIIFKKSRLTCENSLNSSPSKLFANSVIIIDTSSILAPLAFILSMILTLTEGSLNISLSFSLISGDTKMKSSSSNCIKAPNASRKLLASSTSSSVFKISDNLLFNTCSKSLSIIPPKENEILERISLHMLRQ